MSHAAYRGQLGALQLLLGRGADLTIAPPLHAALGRLRLGLGLGIGLGLGLGLEGFDPNSNPNLIRGAALRGKRLTKAVELLLAAGAPADGLALAMAAEAGEAGAAAALLRAGAQVEAAVGSSGSTPLIKAAAAGDIGEI